MADINIEDVLKKLTLAEKVDLLAGSDFWHTKALPAHGIPSLRMSDGPNGVRGTKFFNGVSSACFPCGTALGSTFNQQLLEQAGKKMGEEALAKNAHIILGPTINMQRSPLGGRGFESIGEDPFLAGLGAAALVRGIQSTGVQATIKHFLCNDQEDKRMGVQSIVTERALREIYALPLQLAVRDARPGAFMTAYNGINGTMCSENSKYLDGMLRKEWGWEGLIMSDWYGTYSTTLAVVAGLDLEMPGPARFRGEALNFNASTNKPFTHVIDQRVRAVLRLVKKVSGLDIKELGPEREANTPKTAALLRKIGNASIVLLKNDNNVLPSKKDKKTYNPKVADTWYADLEGSFVPDEDCTYELGLVVSGTAKAFVNNELIVDNATKQVAGDAFFGAATREERGFVALKKGEKYDLRVELGSAPRFTLKGDASVPGHGSLGVGGCKVIDDQEEIKKSVQLAKEYDQVIICAGLSSDWETEGADRVSMKLPGVLDQLITQVAAANSNTAVVMQTGTPEEMPWLEKTPAVVQAWYGGNETGNCIADILFGDANPSGKLSLSFPKRLRDVPSFLNFRAEAGRTLYGEDVYIGYRYYEFANRAVNFPFGHGLSYTSFSFSELSVTSSEGKVTAALKVTNTGSTKGSEVAQMYIQPKQAAKINRPVKELRGFAKIELEAGETRMVTITELEKYVAAYWDEEREQWYVEAGEYEVIISDSSVVRDEKAVRGSFKVSASYWWDGI
ncbi:Cel3c putative beta-glucosidase [Metarhizium acridum CQMa 102]|uniref:beta-glucosidase n=1 Tax=Metarhizium acridum (strain CQMa 102) TaxID=655827 RepID=E9E3S4_METAQ|nr:Cel3c putative beta-glucosidase [Metarhizium acridum CQMa 102]EFY89499.1 Cel3c putative beta-glucosidase [Metarhizium acridum CQMa 102]